MQSPKNIKKPMKKRNESLFISFLKKEWFITKRSLNELIGNYAILMTRYHFSCTS
jgi:hypothetical protein